MIFFESDESLRNLVQRQKREIPGAAGNRAAEDLALIFNMIDCCFAALFR